MAEMFPPECRADTRSKAERRFFGRLKAETGGDWFVLHSVGLTGHDRKPWAEIDFVLIGPPGIFCLEVKGGRVSRQGGRWHFTDGDGNVTVKDEGPFEQVAVVAAKLRKHLAAFHPTLQFIPVGWAVVTPDIIFEISGPDIEPRLVYDERDGARPVSAWLRRIADYWHGELERITGHPVVALDDRQRRTALEFLRGDFDFRPSLRTRAEMIRDEMFRLTTEQYRVLDGLRDNDRSLIRGCAGSGKTLLAVEEARRRASAGARVFFCCRSPRLASWLRMSVADVSGIDCRDLRSLMAETIRAAQLTDHLPAADEADLFAVFMPDLCVEALLQLERAQNYDVLIIDEAQDLLTTDFLEVFDALLAGGLRGGKWMMFLDAYQDVFQTIAPSGWRGLIEARPAQFRLTVNCRNTREVAVATQILSGLAWEETLHATGPEVEQEFCADDAAIRRACSKCVGRWLSQGVEPHRIVVLSPLTFTQSAMASGFLNIAAPLVQQPDATAQNAVAFHSIDDFKGLERDFVAVVDVDDLDDAESLLLLYVAASRARIGLAVFMHSSVEAAYALQAANFGKRHAAANLQT